MRIAYVTEWNPYEPSGVLQKILGQVMAWKSAGASVRIFALAPVRDSLCAFDFDDHGEVIGRISQAALERFRFARLGYFNKIGSAIVLRNVVEKFDPDVIYYRHQGPWYPGIGKILRLAPSVAELNGNAEGEIVWGQLSARVQHLTDPLWQRFVTAFLAVSPDIAEDFRGKGKPVAVIPNSLPCNPRPLAPTKNKTPAFVFVGSALPGGGAWHGIDKIIDLATHLPASCFEIVGFMRSDLSDLSIPDNVRFHGPKYGKELEAIYQKCDVGIGTLALHRRGMNTTSALKPLEYLIFGLPVILGYTETEPRLNSADYTLSIGNHEGNIRDNIESITAFAENWRGRRVLADLKYLSSSIIERRRLDFLEALMK